jgi:hypothetical protein
MIKVEVCKRIMKWLAVISLFVICCPTSASAQKNYLYFSVENFKHPSFSIKAANGKAIVLRYSGGMGLSDPQSTCCVGEYSEHQLDILIKALRLAKVQNWDTRYVNDEVRDGTWWKIKLTSGEFRFESSGSNAFPENFNDIVTLIQTIEESLECEKKLTYAGR